MSDAANEFDVIVVGAGPGGIAAAGAAAAGGKSVALIDDSPFPGGQIWRNQGKPSSAAMKWIDRLGPVTLFAQSRVVSVIMDDEHHNEPRTERTREVSGLGAQTAYSGSTLRARLIVETPNGARVLRYKSLVLATGARELFLPFPGWTLPGVVGAGGIQALVKQGYPVRGKRIVVGGSGPLLLAVADLLQSKGAAVPLILEQTSAAKLRSFVLSLLASPSKLLQGAALRWRLRGTRYSTDSYPTAAMKTSRGLSVNYQSAGKSETIECDHLACGFGLIPNNELAQLLGCEIGAGGFVTVNDSVTTSVADVYAVGELNGIGGVDKALFEGQLAAHSILSGGTGFQPVRTHGQDAHATFVRKLRETFALRSELFQLSKPETIVCRCEDVPLSAVAHSLSSRDAKLQTRCGMGPCQGRVCGPTLQNLIGAEAAQVRPPIIAARLETLAVES